MRNSLIAPLAFLLLWNGGDQRPGGRGGGGGGSVLAHDDDDDPDHTHEDGAEEEEEEEAAAAMVPTDGSVTSSKLQIHVSKQCPGGFGGGGGRLFPSSSPLPRYHLVDRFRWKCIAYIFFSSTQYLVLFAFHIPYSAKNKNKNTM